MQAPEIVQWVKVLVTQVTDLSSISETHSGIKELILESCPVTPYMFAMA